MTHRYYVAKACAFLDACQADDDADPTELAEWAQAQPRATRDDQTPRRRGVLINRKGRIVAETEAVPETPSSPGAWYVASGPKEGRIIDLAYPDHVMVTYDDVCEGSMLRADQLLDSTEVAELLEVSQKSINVAMSSPEVSPRVARILPAPLRKIGRSWVWRRSDVEAAIAAENA